MNIGQKVRELRIAKNLTQEELADRSELSKGFISQLERDLTSPSIATLVDILQCLGTNLNEFFSDDEEEQVVFGDEDYFEKKDTDLKNTIEWIIPNGHFVHKARLNAGGTAVNLFRRFAVFAIA